MDKENKAYSMSIRVSKDELEKLKQAARIEAYSSYSKKDGSFRSIPYSCISE